MDLCVLFCGQGSQTPGMGKTLYDASAQVRQLFACGSDILGFDLPKTCFEGDEETLRKTEIAQPAIYAVSMAGWLLLHEGLEQAGNHVSAVAGHSLGEYGALTAAGVFTPEDGFRLLKARAAAMSRVAAATKGAMYAIVGADEQTVEQVCTQTEGYVLPVNYNAPTQTVIAGEEAPAAAAAEAFTAMGLRAVRLGVAGAFHTRLFETAARQFEEEIKSIAYGVPQIPFYSNLTGERLDSLASYGGLGGYLGLHMVSPVLFTRQLQGLSAAGCRRFAEAGPGKVLCGLVRKSSKGSKTFALEDLGGVHKALESLA